MAGSAAPLTDPPARPGKDAARRTRLLVAGVAVVAIAVLLAVTIGGLNRATSPTTTPSTAVGSTPPYAADLSLVPVVATPVSPGASSSAGAASVGPVASPSIEGLVTGQGIRAKRIRIERLDIDLRIIEGDGIDAPIGKAAHYPGTAWPGGGSNIYIYGHAREGMFIDLWKAKVGDVVELELVDGTTRTYTVDEVLPKVPWDATKYLRPTDSEQLTLQTSTSYHPTSPRFIVIAYPAP